MIVGVEANRLREILELVEESLDEPEFAAAELADRAYLSRYHFDRLVRAALGEPPGAFRRRLLLERAAYRLATTDTTVIDIAVEAGYASPDAFTRAFARGFGCAPSQYRTGASPRHELAAANGIHFHPPGGLRLPALERTDTMDVLTGMFDHHIRLTGAIVDRVAALPDDVVDRPITMSVDGIDRDPTLRRIAGRLVGQLQQWTTVLEGGDSIPADPSDAPSQRELLARAAPRFRELVLDRIAAGHADDTILDATCDPPETFSLGGILAHVLTFSAARRTLALGALASAGVHDLGAGDPHLFVGGTGTDASSVRRNFDE
jgi:AraC-like DNA-binding protein